MLVTAATVAYAPPALLCGSAALPVVHVWRVAAGLSYGKQPVHQ